MTETSEVSLGQLIEGCDPSATALIHEQRSWTYGELVDASRRVAGGLAAAGVREGDRVGIWLPNIPEWLVMYFACARLGAIGVAINTRFRSSEVEDIVGRSGCRVLAFWPGFKNIDFSGILEEVSPAALESVEQVIVCRQAEGSTPQPLPGRATHRYEELDDSAPIEREAGGPESPCTIFTTSGTTSKPKFVVHVQRAITRHARQVVPAFGMDVPGAAMLHVLPFCGTFGHAQAMAALAAGMPLVLQTAFDAAEAIELGRRHHITHLNGTDDMIAWMLAATDLEKPLPDLGFVGYARFAGISGLAEDAAARGVILRGLYGMSECQALFALQPAGDPERTPLPGGMPTSPQAAVRAVDAESRQTLPDGEVGELEVKGPSVMIGYFGNEEATAKVFTADGYLRTGDMGYTTGDGGFVFTARAGDVLRLGGFLVAPAEIESYLERHPAVRSCAVVSGDNAHANKAVAFVAAEPGQGTDEDALRRYCTEGLAKFKVPARIFVLDELPTVPGPNGAKIRRNQLREWADEWTRDD